MDQIFKSLKLSDYEIDGLSGFIDPKPPLLRFSGEYEIWQIALDTASKGGVSLRGVGESGDEWRECIRNMPLLSLPTTKEQIRHCHVVLSFITQFYVHSQALPQPCPVVIPKSIAIPLCQASEILGLPPIITYADTVLWNWKYTLNQKSHSCTIQDFSQIKTRDIECIFQFTSTSSENYFYVVSAMIELCGAKSLCIMEEMEQLLFMPLDTTLSQLTEYLHDLTDVINQVCKVFDEIFTLVDPDVFYHAIRPWFNGVTSEEDGKVNGWHYEGVDSCGKTRVYGGPSAGQSSWFHSMDAFLSINHSPGQIDNDPLTPPTLTPRGSFSSEASSLFSAAMDKNNDEDETDNFNSESFKEETFMIKMMNYMPRSHREFIYRLLNLKKPLRRIVEQSDDQFLRAAFNRTVLTMTKLRAQHMHVVSKYIIAPARRPNPFIAPNGKHLDIPTYRYKNIQALQSTNFEDCEISALKGTGGSNLVQFLKLCIERTKNALV